MKLVFNGDCATGKTCLLVRYAENKFPDEFVHHYSANVSVGSGKAIGKACAGAVDVPDVVSVGLWDTAGREDYDRLRPLSYPNTNCFVVTASICSPTSVHNVTAKWLPEIFHHCPGARVVLCLTKTDLADDEELSAKLRERGDPDCAAQRAALHAVAKKHGCRVVETSALTGEGVAEAFDVIIAEGLLHHGGSSARGGTAGGFMGALRRLVGLK